MSSTTLALSKPIALRAWHLILVVAILLTASSVALFSNGDQKVEVEAATVGYHDIDASVTATGTVVPENDYPARATFTGLVDKIYVHLGQKVHVGDPLVHMKDQYAVPRLENAKASLLATEVSNENIEHNGSREDLIGLTAEMERANAEQSAASSALKTLKQLQANGSAADAEIAAATQRLDSANVAVETLQQRTTDRYSKTDIQSWKARLAAEKAALEAEKVSYSNSNITSPVSGTVYILPVALYDFVPAGGDMLHIADFSKLRINADFYEADVSRLQIGQPVKVTWDGNPHKSWQGTIVARPFALNGGGAFRTGRSVIEFNDQAGDIPVNTNVTVMVTTETHRHVITIPRDGLQTDGSIHFVFRVVDGQLTRTPVQIGILSAMQAEITEGLKPNDVIALHPLGDLKMKDGAKVMTHHNG